VAQSGMMNEYIRRFHDKERREKAKKEIPDLYAILEETYGVMVYQEDVIKVAHYFCRSFTFRSGYIAQGNVLEIS